MIFIPNYRFRTRKGHIHLVVNMSDLSIEARLRLYLDENSEIDDKIDNDNQFSEVCRFYTELSGVDYPLADDSYQPQKRVNIFDIDGFLPLEVLRYKNKQSSSIRVPIIDSRTRRFNDRSRNIKMASLIGLSNGALVTPIYPTQKGYIDIRQGVCQVILSEPEKTKELIFMSANGNN